jgi:hypothetical protein
VEEIDFGAFAFENNMPNCTLQIGPANAESVWDI